MRLISTLSILAGLVLSGQAAILPQAPTATPAPTPASKNLPIDPATPTPIATLQKRCDGGSTCNDVTAGPEVPIAVTTTMMTTKLVPCTTTTTVIDSQTTTLTLWSTEVQTSTEHISGASTITVWLVTPAPEIKSKTWAQEETFTFIRTGTATSYWTETKAVQTSMVTVTGPETTWTDGGKPAPTSCHDCDNGQDDAPPPPAPTTSTAQAPPQPAWTQTTAGGANASPVPLAGGTNPAPPSGGSVAPVGWMNNPQAPGAAASPAGPWSSTSGTGLPSGAPIATGPGIATPSPANAQGIPLQPGANPNGAATPGAAVDSPFTSDAVPRSKIFASSAVLLVGTVVSFVCSVVML